MKMDTRFVFLPFVLVSYMTSTLPVRKYRLVAVGVAVLLPAFGFAIQQHHPLSTDPMWIRWLLSGWLVGLTALTYLDGWEGRVRTPLKATAWGLTGWYLTLTVVNGYATAYAFGIALVLPAAGSILSLLVDRVWHIRSYYLMTGMVVGVTVPFSSLPLPLKLFYLACVVTLLIIMDLTQEGKLRTEKARQENHQKYKSLFEDSNDAIVVHDLSGRILDANAKAAATFECAVEDLMDRSILELHAENSGSGVRRKLEELRDGRSFRTTARYERMDGSRFWGEVSANGVDLNSRRIVRSMIRDVTVEKEAQREQAQLAAIVRSSHNAIISTAFDGTIETWNAAAEELYGYSAEEAIGQSISIIVPPDEETAFHELVDAVLNGQRVHSMETVRRRKDGRRIEVLNNISPIVGKSGEVTGMAGIVQDLTERRRVERQIRVQASALEAAANAIAIMDRDGIIIWVNPAFTELTGYAYDEVIGETPEILHSGEQDPSFYTELWETILSGAVWHGELVNQRKDGTTYVEEQTITPVENEAGDIHHFIAVKQDVTERKERKEELIRAKETAEEMNRLKSSFLANMSHEIRTPLASIIGYADLLMSEPSASSEELIPRVEHIQQNGERLLNTLNSVLDLAQIESGALKLAPERFDAGEEVGGVVDSLQLQADHKALELRRDWPDEPLPVFMDKGILSRITTNLLHNAIKFTHDGYIRVGCMQTDDGRGLLLEVDDTGIGMADEFVGDLFGPFRQESTGLNRQYEGSGLGLTITHHLVELAGGSIDVESEKGSGTTFTVIFPDVLAPVSGEPDAAEPAGSSAGVGELPPNQRVLIVDDDPAVRELLADMLPESYRVDVTGRPEQAVRLAGDNTYDIVLLDINLKHTLDGVEVLEQLQQQTDLSETVVLAITAYALPGDAESFLEAGFTGYISKPFTRGDLKNIIAGHLTGEAA